MARRRGSDAWQSLWGDELDPALDVRMRCKKNSVLSCIGKRTAEGCDRGSEIGQFTAGDTGKGISSEETERIWQKRELLERYRL